MYVVRNGRLAQKWAQALADRARGVTYGAMSDAEMARTMEKPTKKKKKPVFGALSEKEVKGLKK